MGCILNKNVVAKKKDSVKTRRNTLVTKPTVKVAAGTGINIENSDLSQIIFIFGGPGSGKGTVVCNLVEMFKFRFICGEDLILSHLSTKLNEGSEVKNEVGSTYQLVKLLSEDSSMVTLHLVMELIKVEISKYPGEKVLVDMVPNMKFLLRSPTFVKDCVEEMIAFEETHPVAFAINLALDQNQLMANLNQKHARSNSTLAVQNTSSNGKVNSSNTSDEMDTSRTTHRFNIYMNSVKDFIAYFDNGSRLLNVDTSQGSVEGVWDGVKSYVLDSEICTPTNGIEQIVLIKTKENHYKDVDRERYPMLDVNCKDLVENIADASPVDIMSKLRCHMRKNAVDWKTFLVDVQGSSLCNITRLKEIKKKELLFLEQEIGQLDYFMHKLKRRTFRKKSMLRKCAQIYKSVTTSENEALIFPSDFDKELCHLIALCYLSA
ncbi:uncharacterized protein LOC136071896 [Hydra vulgaris]|uniref:Uncharacterized protein LOC136071896 n=1 Tax=Hydra vulgaris TaxID=6087 RepID=A0ABM4BWS5_HYDVU